MPCLNPCCSGRWSCTVWIVSHFQASTCLNPCCSGRWSCTEYDTYDDDLKHCVLILVVVEDGLVHLVLRYS